MKDITGSFHLIRPEPERMEKTGAYPGSLSLDALHACHRTSLLSKIALADNCPVQEFGVGMKFYREGQGNPSKKRKKYTRFDRKRIIIIISWHEC